MRKLLSLLWRGWKKFAHALGVVQTRILLTVSYFIIIAFASAITKLLGKDLLDRRVKRKPTYYHDHEPVQPTLEACRRQF